MSERPKPATISEVATAAGVSRATVSRVVNGKATVDAAIASRVREVIDALGYRPSAVAQNLSLGRTQTIAVLVPDLENPMFQEVLRGVTTAAALDGYRVLVADSEENAAEEGAIAVEARRRCDALVLCAPRMPDAELQALLPRLAPVVVLNRETAEAPTITVDYSAAIEEAIAHLVELGHSRLVYLTGPPQSASDVLRKQGIDSAVTATPTVTVVEIPAGAQLDDGYRLAEEVLASGATAVIAYNDLVAFGLLTRLRELSVAVPGTISVVGFDDIPLARFAFPPLTTMAAPRLELGTQAWAALKERIAGSSRGGDRDSKSTAIRHRATLVRRESAGAAPASAAPQQVSR